MNIKEISNNDLVEYFEGSIRDVHYSPTDIKWNKSHFSMEQLCFELLSRLNAINRDKGNQRYIEAEKEIMKILDLPWYKKIFINKRIINFLKDRLTKYDF